MIHICYGLYDRDGRYSKFVGTSMASVFENTTQSVTVHILHDNTLSDENRDRFIYLTGRYGQHVEFYNVETLAAEQIAELKTGLPEVLRAQYSIGSVYRLLIPRLMESLAKIIYLDADILVNLDVNELWQIELGTHPLASVNETLIHAGLERPDSDKYLIKGGFVNAEDYFDSGVLVMNIEYFREHDGVILDGYKFVCEHPECRLFDQDILNYCFAAQSLKLPVKFNSFVVMQRLGEPPRGVQRAIYHYSGDSLDVDINEPFNRLYFEYFVKTPWFSIEMFVGLFDGINRLVDRKKQQSIHMTRMLSTKRRAFFAEADNYEALREIFGIHDDEPTYNSSVDDALERLIDVMREDDGQHLFIIIVADFAGLRYHLNRNNFVEGRDFINGVELLPSVNGFPIYTKSIADAL